ncbi:hypothetical protein BGY98DRAFT_936386 [Russula aff. rugulosa BPL654]|nr:hypothetical protein BGY98DRAFT_936386 [Russula aff. rugulosa BPL654]
MDGKQAIQMDISQSQHIGSKSQHPKMELKSALIAFTRLNNAHNGERLGQALFKIIKQVGIEHKVGHVTCDNASNNRTIMKEFAVRLKITTGKKYDSKKRKLSKSLHFDPKQSDAHVPTSRDEVGLCVDAFVDELRWKEQDSAKCDKICELKLTKDEWSHVNTFLRLLGAFSSENASTLHLGIPALEALHKAWSSCVDRPEFEPFAPALCAAYEKINEYYEKTTESPAYFVRMMARKAGRELASHEDGPMSCLPASMFALVPTPPSSSERTRLPETSSQGHRVAHEQHQPEVLAYKAAGTSLQGHCVAHKQCKVYEEPSMSMFLMSLMTGTRTGVD